MRPVTQFERAQGGTNGAKLPASRVFTAGVSAPSPYSAPVSAPGPALVHGNKGTAMQNHPTVSHAPPTSALMPTHGNLLAQGSMGTAMQDGPTASQAPLLSALMPAHGQVIVPGSMITFMQNGSTASHALPLSASSPAPRHTLVHGSMGATTQHGPTLPQGVSGLTVPSPLVYGLTSNGGMGTVSEAPLPNLYMYAPARNLNIATLLGYEVSLEELGIVGLAELGRLEMSVGTVWRHEKVGRIVIVFRCLREKSIYNVGATLYRLAAGRWDER
jgi:hypothetical protein